MIELILHGFIDRPRRKQAVVPRGIATGDLDRVFGQLMGPSIDAADLYFQHSRSESWTLEEGIVKDGSHSIEQGVGVRGAISGEKTGFAYSDEIVLPQLLEASKAARAIARDGHGAGKPLALHNARALYPAIDPVESLPNPDKIALLREVDAYARARDPRIKQVIVSMAATIDTVLIAASDGTLAADVRPLVRLTCAIAEANGRREQGYSGGGGRYGYREPLENGRALRFADEAVRQGCGP
ncbi:PmbA/TldA family metallopeptidase [Rhodanobacter lindaniclasticus]